MARVWYVHYYIGLLWTAACSPQFYIITFGNRNKTRISIQDCKIIVVYIGIYLLFCSVFSSFDDDEGDGMTKYH